MRLGKLIIAANIEYWNVRDTNCLSWQYISRWLHVQGLGWAQHELDASSSLVSAGNSFHNAICKIAEKSVRLERI